MLPGTRKPESQRDAEVQEERTVWTVIEEIIEREPTGIAAHDADPHHTTVVPLPMAGDVPAEMTRPLAGPGSPNWQLMLKELQKRRVLKPVASIQSVSERGLMDPSGELSKEDLSGDPNSVAMPPETDLIPIPANLYQEPRIKETLSFLTEALNESGALIEVCTHIEIDVVTDGSAAGEIKRRSDAYHKAPPSDRGPTGSTGLTATLASAGLPDLMDVDTGTTDVDGPDSATTAQADVAQVIDSSTSTEDEAEAGTYQVEVAAATRVVAAVEDAEASTEPITGSRRAPETIRVPLSESGSEVMSPVSVHAAEGPTTPFAAHLVEGPQLPVGPVTVHSGNFRISTALGLTPKFQRWSRTLIRRANELTAVEAAELLEEQLSFHGSVRDERRDRAVIMLAASLRETTGPWPDTGRGPTGSAGQSSVEPPAPTMPTTGREVWELVAARADTAGPRGPDVYPTYDAYREAMGCLRPRYDPGWYRMDEYGDADIEGKMDANMYGPVSQDQLGPGRFLSIATDNNLALMMQEFEGTGYEGRQFSYLWKQVSQWLSKWLRHAKLRSEPHHPAYPEVPSMDAGGWVEAKELMKYAERSCEGFIQMRLSNYTANRAPSGSSGSAMAPSLPHGSSLQEKKEYLFLACLARSAMEQSGKHGTRKERFAIAVSTPVMVQEGREGELVQQRYCKGPKSVRLIRAGQGHSVDIVMLERIGSKLTQTQVVSLSCLCHRTSREHFGSIMAFGTAARGTSREPKLRETMLAFLRLRPQRPSLQIRQPEGWRPL